MLPIQIIARVYFVAVAAVGAGVALAAASGADGAPSLQAQHEVPSTSSSERPMALPNAVSKPPLRKVLGAFSRSARAEMAPWAVAGADGYAIGPLAVSLIEERGVVTALVASSQSMKTEADCNTASSWLGPMPAVPGMRSESVCESQARKLRLQLVPIRPAKR